MSQISIKNKTLKGTVKVPPSKSMAHRAIICAALARGESRIDNIVYSKDIEATIHAMKALGTIIFQEDHALIIDGTTTFMKQGIKIDCHESGSTLRFMVPVSLVESNNVHFVGQGQLGKRPLDVYYDIFEKQDIAYLYRQDVLDLFIKGQLLPDTFKVPGNISSQFITGLLFALPLLNGDSIIEITSELESKGYIDLTLQMLKRYGIKIINEDYKRFIVLGNQEYQPCDYRVEADFSQAAFYLVADAIGNDIVLEDLNLNSAQGDKEIIDILERMGCTLTKKDQGYVMTCDELTATTVDASSCPDIIPVLSVACAYAKGTSRIMNAKRLRIKECDRLSATVEVLRELGVSVEEKEDEMIIEGCHKLTGSNVSSYNDHRMAMMEAIASSILDQELIIDNKECVSKSYPNFWEDFTSLGGEYNEC